jgi:hypothetical protein
MGEPRLPGLLSGRRANGRRGLQAARVAALAFLTCTKAAAAEDTFPTRLSRTTALPPQNQSYVQYGVALAAELVANPGAMCRTADPFCILGSGGGVAARGGIRFAGPWYLGGAYEMSKQDPDNLYRFATLQQLRAEVRRHVLTDLATEPYVGAALGVSAYGNEWRVDTWGPQVGLSVGATVQMSRTTLVGGALWYRAMLFQPFTDSSLTRHALSLAQFVALEVTIEVRDPR